MGDICESLPAWFYDDQGFVFNGFPNDTDPDHLPKRWHLARTRSS